MLPQNLFAASLFPYLGFLYHLNRATKATKAPGLMLFGFYFLLVFVGASIPAGIYGARRGRSGPSPAGCCGGAWPAAVRVL